MNASPLSMAACMHSLTSGAVLRLVPLCQIRQLASVDAGAIEIPEMASWYESRSSIFRSYLAASHEQSHSGLAIHVSCVIPFGHFCMYIVPNVIISVKWLCLSAWANPHSHTRMDIGLRHGLFSVVAPPEPAARCQEVVANCAIQRIHDLCHCVCWAEPNHPRRALRFLCVGISFLGNEQEKVGSIYLLGKNSPSHTMSLSSLSRQSS